MDVAASHPAHCDHCDGRARPETIKHLAWAGGLLSILPLTYIASPWLDRDSLPMLCPFRCVTGRPCPFCGLTRAIAAATHFQWSKALHLNPLWPLAGAIILLFAVLHLADAAQERQRTNRLARMLQSHWIWLLAALIAFDVWRINAGW